MMCLANITAVLFEKLVSPADGDSNSVWELTRQMHAPNCQLTAANHSKDPNIQSMLLLPQSTGRMPVYCECLPAMLSTW